jgi:hypothetical protein
MYYNLLHTLSDPFISTVNFCYPVVYNKQYEIGSNFNKSDLHKNIAINKRHDG